MHFNLLFTEIRPATALIRFDLIGLKDAAVRQFLLANLYDFHGQYKWKVNLAAVGWQLNEIQRFPHFHASYYGDALFIGGSNSNIVGYDSILWLYYA